MIGAGRKKKTHPIKTIRMKGKLVTGKPFSMYNGFHNQIHASFKLRPKLIETTNELHNHPITSLAVLSQVTQAESETKGLTLVRRKRKKDRTEATGFMALLGYI